MGMRDIEDVLVALKGDNLGMGSAWERAHELAQNHEGETAYDRLHALVHRIEGDASNAAYWYRRAGEPVFQGDLGEEVELLLERATA